MMDTAPALPPLRARQLVPTLPVEATIVSGHLEPTEIKRGSRPAVSFNGEIVAGGGWPAPVRRTMGFVVLPPAQTPVNVVTGVPSHPQNPARGKRRTSR